MGNPARLSLRPRLCDVPRWRVENKAPTKICFELDQNQKVAEAPVRMLMLGAEGSAGAFDPGRLHGPRRGGSKCSRKSSIRSATWGSPASLP